MTLYTPLLCILPIQTLREYASLLTLNIKYPGFPPRLHIKLWMLVLSDADRMKSVQRDSMEGEEEKAEPS